MHPDVQALIAGAQNQQPAGPPPSIQVNPQDHPDATGGQAFGDQIRQALDQIRTAIQSDNASDSEKLIAEKMTTLGQQLLATHEKEHQAAMGGGPATNFLRRTVGSGIQPA